MDTMRKDRLHFAMPRTVPPGLWRRVPPAVFPPLLGGLALALAWLGGTAAFALPRALAELLAGMTLAIAAFTIIAYAVKLARRPRVLAEELSILPGRAGAAAGVLVLYLVAALLAALGFGGGGRFLLGAALILHGVFLLVLVGVLRGLPPEQRRVSPAFHLSFTGPIVASRAALLAGWPALAAWLFWPSVAVALVIYAVSLRQAIRARVPAPLRPMLAIHLAPIALFGTVALGLGWTAAGVALAWLALAGLLALVAAARWLLADGFSALWGALTFPIAATAGLWVALWQVQPSETHRLIAGAVLILATLVVIPILALILKAWAQGRLPVKTNSAIA